MSDFEMIDVTGSVDEYQGKKLETPIKFSTQAKQYKSVDALRAAGEWPNDAEILKAQNAKLKNLARQKKYQEVTADLKRDYENSPEFKRKQVVDSLTTAGFTPEQIETILAQKGL